MLGCASYSESVDIWSIGCVLGELVETRAIFPGVSEIDQLFSIFAAMGTPTEASWPGVSKLPHFEEGKFPRFRQEEQQEEKERAGGRARLGVEGQELMRGMLVCDPRCRISATEAVLRATRFRDAVQRDTPA